MKKQPPNTPTSATLHHAHAMTSLVQNDASMTKANKNEVTHPWRIHRLNWSKTRVDASSRFCANWKPCYQFWTSRNKSEQKRGDANEVTLNVLTCVYNVGYCVRKTAAVPKQGLSRISVQSAKDPIWVQLLWAQIQYEGMGHPLRSTDLWVCSLPSASIWKGWGIPCGALICGYAPSLPLNPWACYSTYLCCRNGHMPRVTHGHETATRMRVAVIGDIV